MKTIFARSAFLNEKVEIPSFIHNFQVLTGLDDDLHYIKVLVDRGFGIEENAKYKITIEKVEETE